VHAAKQTATSFALIVESAYNERSRSLDLSAKFSSPSVPDVVWHKGEAGVENLSLAKNGLAALPAQIEAFGRLRRLDLGDNKLTALPLELGKCVLLEELILQKNCLTEIPAVYELTRLTELDVRYPPLPPAPRATPTAWPDVSRVWGSFNRIAVLPIGIAQLVSLTILRARQNAIRALPSGKSIVGPRVRACVRACGMRLTALLQSCTCCLSSTCWTSSSTRSRPSMWSSRS
jgi:hypothetical protein